MTAARPPLQNRVDPFGAIHATSARGTLLGNRGGRFHRATHDLGDRRWASRQWIACVLSFKGRRRVPMTEGYTELFFLDEPTALAAGHRPCFECRRADAARFAIAWARAKGLAAPPRVAEMDAFLHAERLDGRDKRLSRMACEALPDGVMIARDGAAHLILGERALPWSFDGYGAPAPRPIGVVDVLTPPSIVATMLAGYSPDLSFANGGDTALNRR